MGEHTSGPQGENPAREPVFLLPPMVAGLAGILIAIHLAGLFVLDEEGRLELLLTFAFLPLRIPAMLIEGWEVGLPLLWTPFTHALLHDGWEHLLVNCAWLLIFATPVSRRYGALPTLAIFFVGAAAGALAFAATNYAHASYLIGASGGVSGLTGAAIRFMFQPVLVGVDPETGERHVLGRRLLSLGGVLGEPRARSFALIWVGLNAALPLLPLLTGIDTQIAWQAHLGGFAAGFLLVGAFEREAAPVR